MVYFDFIPITVPEDLEKLMQKILPYKLLYPLRNFSKPSCQSQEVVRQSPISKPQHIETEKFNTETTPSPQPKNTRVHFENHTEKSPQEIKKDKSTRVDFSGVWKRDKCENIDAYVGAQGAGFMQRKLAASMVFFKRSNIHVFI